MADWNLPLLTSLYQDFMNLLKARDEDAVTLGKNGYTNGIVGTITYDRVANKFKEWSGTGWVDLIISMASGGLGVNNPPAARAVLGIGTMGTQNANNVAITGGTVSNLSSLSVNGVASTGDLTVNGNAYTTGTATAAVEVVSNKITSYGPLSGGSLGVTTTASIGGLATLGSLSVTGASALNGNVTAGPLTSTSLNTGAATSTSLNTGAIISTSVVVNGGNVNAVHAAFSGQLWLGTPANSVSNAIGKLDATKFFGIVPTANLGTGTANIGTFLRGDGTWAGVNVSSYRRNQYVRVQVLIQTGQNEYDVSLSGFTDPSKMFFVAASAFGVPNFLDTDWYIGHYWFPNNTTLRFQVTELNADAGMYHYIAGMVLELA